MLMNKKVAISLIVVAVVIGIGITVLTNPSQPAEPTKPTTNVTSSTSKTSNDQAQITTDTSGTELNTVRTDESSRNDTDNKETQAKYATFSVDEFKKTKGTRVLFFYSDNSQACKDLEADLKKNLKELKDDTTIFKIDFNKEKEIAKAYGVVKETTVLKFDDKTQVTGVFIAYDYPTTAALITNLGV
jgi:thiol-disulfide isomerase/thioredoxin